MNVLQALVLLASALVASGQRPSFAGSRPIGYPELANRTTTPSGLEDKFGEGTTQRLPIEAGGDRELIDRLSKLPIDKQPFWFINWQAYEANRDKPQTYPLRPNPFIDGNLQITTNTNTGIANNNPGPSVASTSSVNVNPCSTNGSPGFVDGQSGIINKNSNPNVIHNDANIEMNPKVDDTTVKKNALENSDKITDSTRKSDPSFADNVPLMPIYTDLKKENVLATISDNNNPTNIATNVDENLESLNTDITKDDSEEPEPVAPANDNDTKPLYLRPASGAGSENISATAVIDSNKNVKADIAKELEPTPTKPDTKYTEIESLETEKSFDTLEDKITDSSSGNDEKSSDKLGVSHEDSKKSDTAKSERKYKYSRVHFSSEEEDEYEDIKVRDDIKLFPGIIQKYQK